MQATILKLSGSYRMGMKLRRNLSKVVQWEPERDKRGHYGTKPSKLTILKHLLCPDGDHYRYIQLAADLGLTIMCAQALRLGEHLKGPGQNICLKDTVSYIELLSLNSHLNKATIITPVDMLT